MTAGEIFVIRSILEIFRTLLLAVAGILIFYDFLFENKQGGIRNYFKKRWLGLKNNIWLSMPEKMIKSFIRAESAVANYSYDILLVKKDPIQLQIILGVFGVMSFFTVIWLSWGNVLEGLLYGSLLIVSLTVVIKSMDWARDVYLEAELAKIKGGKIGWRTLVFAVLSPLLLYLGGKYLIEPVQIAFKREVYVTAIVMFVTFPIIWVSLIYLIITPLSIISQIFRCKFRSI